MGWITSGHYQSIGLEKGLLIDRCDINVVLNDGYARVTASCHCIKRAMPTCITFAEDNAIVDESHVKT